MRGLAFLFAVVVASATPWASGEVVLFSTGYEPPTYSVGPLDGQDDWSGFFGGSVTSDRSLSGSQSLQLSGFSFGSRPAFATTAPIVTLRQAVYIERPDPGAVVEDNFFMRPFIATGDDPDNVGAANDGDFLGQVLVVKGDSPSGLVAALEAGNGNLGLVPVELDEWFVLEHVLNLETQTQEAFVDGQLIGSAPFANRATAFDGTDHVAISTDNHEVFLDDLSITAVPEPGGLALLCFGGLATLRRRYCRR